MKATNKNKLGEFISHQIMTYSSDVTVCGDFLVVLSLSPDDVSTNDEECVINVNAEDDGQRQRGFLHMLQHHQRD